MTKIFEVTVTYDDGSRHTQQKKSYTSGDAICAFLVALGFDQLEGIKSIQAKELSF